jgi:outer membrane protein TolC
MIRTWIAAMCVVGAALNAAATEPNRLVEELEHSSTYDALDANALPTAPAPTTLDQYVALALERNAGLRAAHSRWRAAMERVPQARSLPDPKLTFGYYVEEIQTRTGPQEYRIELMQMFPWFGTLKSRATAAERMAESAWWAMEAQAQGLVRDVKRAYHDYAYLAQSIDTMQENLTLLKDLEPIVQRRVQTGVASQSSLVRLQVEIGKLENDLASLRDRRETFSMRLRSLINLPGPGVLSAPALPPVRVFDYDRDTLSTRVERDNPELMALERGVAAAEQRKDVARREGYPDFTLGVSYMGTGEAVMTPRPPGSGNDPVMVSVGISLPIWRKKYSASVREAESDRRAATNRRHQRLNDLKADLENTLYRLDDARRQLDLYGDTLLPRAKQALELTEIAYESGSASLLDVIDSQRELLAFTLAYRRAEADYHIQTAELEALCGGPLS